MFPSITKFCYEGRRNHGIATELEGTLLISKCPFPYFMLIAFEAGGPIGSLPLLLIYPLIWVFEISGFDAAALQVMVFISMAGLEMKNIEVVAKAVLPRFNLGDVRDDAHRMWAACGGKWVVTSSPRIMVDTFLREHMDVDCVVATDLTTLGKYCLGLSAGAGVWSGAKRLEALQAAIGVDKKIDVGLSDGLKDDCFKLLCQENYSVPRGKKGSPLPKSHYPKPLIFHDGGFAMKPTPSDCVVIPLGVSLAIARILVAILLPYKLGPLCQAATGLRVRATLPSTCQSHASHAHCTCDSRDGRSHTSCNGTNLGTLYVCSHRTLIGPVVISGTLQRHVTAVSYSISRVSEIISRIRTVRLSRARLKDGEIMRALLSQRDLVVCSEGTTCREPYLLQFSPLFAEVAEEIVPVAVATNVTMFHGTTVRGHKWLDPFFFPHEPHPTLPIGVP